MIVKKAGKVGGGKSSGRFTKIGRLRGGSKMRGCGEERNRTQVKRR